MKFKFLQQWFAGRKSSTKQGDEILKSARQQLAIQRPGNGSTKQGDEILKSALQDVRSREYSADHLKVTQLDLILRPSNWDITPRNNILLWAVAALEKAIAEPSTTSMRAEAALTDIALSAVREADHIINRGMGGLITVDPGYSCVLSNDTRSKLATILGKQGGVPRELGSGAGQGSSTAGVAYFEVPILPSGDGSCSDNACPWPGTAIPRGTGYLYISQEVVAYRRDAQTVAAVEAKMAREGKRGDMFFQPTAILMCEQGAKRRGLDLQVASADARHWWQTGKAPLRATPLAGTKSAGGA